MDNCKVIGIEDDVEGHKPHAFVILKPGYRSQTELIEREINTVCEERLSEYYFPVQYTFCTEFPYTSVGKVNYRRLVAELMKE